MEAIYILVGVVAVVLIYFLFFKKQEPAPPAPPAKKEEERLPEKRVAPAPSEPKEKAEAKAKSVAPEAAAEEPAATTLPSEPPAPAVPPTQAVFKKGPDVEGLRRGLSRSRESEGFFGRLKALFGGKKEISPEIAADIEEILVSSDVGVKTTQELLSRVKQVLGSGEHVDEGKVWDALRDECVSILDVNGKAGPFVLQHKPTVVLMVGVNGAGKTTTIGKLATRLTEEGLTCVLAAGDTFRAAAVQQLIVWGKRVGCEVVRGKDGADPGSVVFEAIKKAQEIGADIVLADTAGRLHTKTNLMAEMQKIARTAGKAIEGAPHETLLVIDATNGQNALAQAQEFKEALSLSGIVLTKLDGTAKGGVVIGISDALKLPVKFVGVGERPDDLHDFSPRAFVEALLGRDAPSN